MKTTILRVSRFWIPGVLGALGMLILGTTLFFGATLAQNAEAQNDSPQLGTNEGDALAMDIAILADEMGLPVESVGRSVVFQQSFSKYVDDLIVRFPDQISSVWVEPVPATQGHVQFTNEVPPSAASGIESHGLTADNVVLTGNGMVTMAEHARRVSLASEAVSGLGHQDTITFFDRFENVLRVEVMLPEKAPQPRKLDIVEAVQNRVNSDQTLKGRSARIEPQDLEITVIRGSGPIFTPVAASLGSVMMSGPTAWCTSGWSVWGTEGSGVTTAGHCIGLNQIWEPGLSAHAAFWQDDEVGSGGDVAYYTVPAYTAPATFYADATNVRPVNSIKTSSTMVGLSACKYGRASNTRTCNHTIEAFPASITYGCCGTIGSLARASNDALIGGDSGGGWSFSYTAWGLSSGHGSGKSYFTPVQETQTALNVTIKTQ